LDVVEDECLDVLLAGRAEGQDSKSRGFQPALAPGQIRVLRSVVQMGKGVVYPPSVMGLLLQAVTMERQVLALVKVKVM
jgi:hypothetical protein